MTTLNRQAAHAAVALSLHCATDVTGFGLLGHAVNLARGSQVTLRFDVRRIPRLPGVAEALAAGIRTGGAERNEEYVRDLVSWGHASADDRALLVDPQTSGGLLVACPGSAVGDYLSRVPGAVVVGEVRDRAEHLVILE
jgi:selenide,water dikinase